MFAPRLPRSEEYDTMPMFFNVISIAHN
jgi:hypothetical protein